MIHRPVHMASRRAFARAGLGALVLAGLAGCATLNSISADVSSFGDWPAARAPGTYAFDRLPSQQAQAAQSQALEDAAAPALAKAGLRPVAAGEQPDVLVQVGLRTARSDRYPWDDPLWFHGGFGTYRRGPWLGPSWGFGLRFEPPRYEREVAVLLRDRASGKPLFEARASHEGTGGADATMAAALFQAALMDFPRTGVNPRTVRVTLP